MISHISGKYHFSQINITYLFYILSTPKTGIKPRKSGTLPGFCRLSQTYIILLPTSTIAYANQEINIPLLSVILFYYSTETVFCSRYFFSDETYRFPTLLRIEFFLVI